jgi:hypothetical protein
MVARADLDANRRESQIALVDVATGALEHLTRRRRAVRHPR